MDYEYKTTSVVWLAETVKDTPKPEGEGWQLVDSCTASGWHGNPPRVFWNWFRVKVDNTTGYEGSVVPNGDSDIVNSNGPYR